MQKRFGYCFDPVFLIAALLYLLNRFALKLATAEQPRLHSFFAGHFNDLICVPFCLPPFLLLTRWVGVRNHDGHPTRIEILGCLGLWSVVFEWIAPQLPSIFPSTVRDSRDVAAYAGGGVQMFLSRYKTATYAAFLTDGSALGLVVSNRATQELSLLS